MITRHHIVLALFIALCLTACNSIIQNGQPTTLKLDTLLESDQTLGQTFTAWDRGLDGVEIYLAPNAPGTGDLTLHLRSGSQSTADLASATLAIESVKTLGFYRFTFAPQTDSRGHAYYLFITTQASDSIRFGTADGASYLDGALYQNGTPVDAQLAFRLSYDPLQWGIGLGRLGLTWLQILAIAMLLFVVPGWALLGWGLPNWDSLSWGERLGLAAGMSVALYPLFLLWTAIFDLHLGAIYAWTPILIAVGAILWRNCYWRPNVIGATWRAWRQSGWALSDVVLIGLIGLIIFTRFWVIRSLDVPLWGDSYQHTMIAQLIVDHGGLFDSWTPYADMQSFTYHFGFHSATAVFHWITDANLPRSILWVGQIFNTLAILSLYPLATRVGNGNRWAGVIAVLIAGLLSQMPMFYLNWGRYTQLAGQVILPAAVLISWIVWKNQNRDWKLIALAWLTVGGLALTHYRILIFFIVFAVCFFFWSARRETWRDLLSKITLTGSGAFLLFLPWFIHTLNSLIASNFANKITTPADSTPIFTQQYNSIGDLAIYLPMPLWLILVASLGIGLWRQKREIVLIGGWWFATLLAANPQWLKLPGQGILSSFAVLIGMYIPAGVLIGAVLGGLRIEPQSAKRWQWVALAVSLCILGLWGTRERLYDVQIANGALATSADLRAATWIETNTLSSDRFLVNSFFAYGDTSIVGSDGGWWLPLLAHRQTTLPPLNYASEQGPRPDYREWINALRTEIQKDGVQSDNVINLLHERGITYLYIGQRQGLVNTDRANALSLTQLLASNRFRSVYHQDRVWIFEIIR